MLLPSSNIAWNLNVLPFRNSSKYHHDPRNSCHLFQDISTARFKTKLTPISHHSSVFKCAKWRRTSLYCSSLFLTATLNLQSPVITVHTSIDGILLVFCTTYRLNVPKFRNKILPPSSWWQWIRWKMKWLGRRTLSAIWIRRRKYWPVTSH